jgi:tetratricopeptide (TPR) repeat protein
MAGLLLLSSWLHVVRVRVPAVTRLDGKRVVLMLATILAGIVGVGAMSWKSHEEVRGSLTWSQAPGGELAQKATLLGLRRGAESGEQAREAFERGDAALSASHFSEATEQYGRSIRAAPTVAGYLNLGMTLLFLEEFHWAEEALRAGLRIAQDEENSWAEGACLESIGRAAQGNGRTEAALGFYREALEIHTRVGNPLGRAIVHTNVGDIYLLQGQLERALRAHQEAFALYTRMELIPGRASALNRLGEVYIRLGRDGEALGAFREALALDTEIGNPLGRANDLRAIASVLGARGERREALEALQEARALYRGLGVGSRDARTAERLLGKLHVTRGEGG